MSLTSFFSIESIARALRRSWVIIYLSKVLVLFKVEKHLSDSAVVIGMVIRGVNRMVRHDSISILIPSYTIFADSLNFLRLDSIQEYIDRYFDIIILYTYFKQPSIFLLTHKCNQNI